MPESVKATVVIASVLKPVDDTRMYSKIGLTLAESGSYSVHVIGQGSHPTEAPNLIQHALKPFSRFSLGRILAPWKIFATILRLKPDVLIVTTHELLCAGLFAKRFTKCRLIYDLQENYYWNILYTPAFPLLIKPFVALYVRGKEVIAAPFIDHFFLAEKGYTREMRFPGSRYTVLENKARRSADSARRSEPVSEKATIQLIFSGTLAETTGVFTAIDLTIKLHVIDERFRLTIIGHAAQRHVREKIRLLIAPRPFIQLIAGDSPVPHGEILKHISRADFGMITYPINPSTMNSIPTKLYEYLGSGLPIILANHKPWVEFCLPYHAAVVFDPNHYDSAVIYDALISGRFYTTTPEGVYWEDEAEKLLAALSR